jgi:hypothetical protein
VNKTDSVCPVCGAAPGSVEGLAEHFVAQADDSDIAHVMWLNRNVTKYQVAAGELTVLLRHYADHGPSGAGRVAR